MGGLHCAYLKDSLTPNGTSEGEVRGTTMTCGDLLTALDPSNLGGTAFGTDEGEGDVLEAATS